VQVGTEILDPTLPSNIDFEEGEKRAIEMVEMRPKHEKEEVPLGKIDLENIEIKSYTIKGKVVFNLEPQYKVHEGLPANTQTFHVKSFNDEYSPGFKRIWETLVGYTNKELYVNQGYIYVLERQKYGLVVVSSMKLVNLFKIFVDYE
jgi:hypothetical protein